MCGSPESWSLRRASPSWAPRRRPRQTVAPPFDDAYALHDLGRAAGRADQPRRTDAQGGHDRPAPDRRFRERGRRRAVRDRADPRRRGPHHRLRRDATRFADADNNDGGVAYGPGGVLFLARYPLAQLGQIQPGSTTTDKVIDLAPHGVAGSLGALTFVPAGLPGAGSLKLASYNGGQWYDAEVVRRTGRHLRPRERDRGPGRRPLRPGGHRLRQPRLGRVQRSEHARVRVGRPAACPPTRWTRAAIPSWPRGATS